MQRIEDWLLQLGMSEYAQRFAENDIDISVLRHLTDQDLKELGVSLGHRRKMLAAIVELAGALQVSPEPTLTGSKPQDTAPRSIGERRQLTVLFCDLVGSTALSTQFDPEDLREIIGVYHRCVAEAVAELDGFVAKYMGDGVLIYFGYPSAHEDDAERAVRAGLSLIERAGRLEAPVQLKVRVGIATGLAIVGDLLGAGAAQERGIVGETPNLAARLQGLAEPGVIAIDPRTHQLLGDLFDYRDLGLVELKGFDVPIQAYQVIGPSAVESRFEAFHPLLTPLIGREDEIELLQRCWQRAKQGKGQVVLVSGEPGIGKSRLTATILEHVAHQPHARLRYFCSPHHANSALYPIIRQLERAAGFERDDEPAAKLPKLETQLSVGSASPEDHRLIADLLSLPDIGRYPALSLSPQQRKQMTVQALFRQLKVLALRQPVLQIFEDMHWADPTSIETMDREIDFIREWPIMLLMTFRPEFTPLWIGQAQVSMIALKRLERREGAELIQRLAANHSLASEMVEEIVDRTDGVPLFIEELTKVVIETGADRRDPNSTIARTALRDVPATLHASLMARFDRLGTAKEVAQVGAAIGREFSYELLSAVSSLRDPDLQAAMNQLTASGLLFGRGSPPDSSYLFKHALVQDVAYGTLLRGGRQKLHARIAEVLEDRFPDRVISEPEVLAHHFAEAQQLGRAADYWLKAGRRAAERSANLEAIRHLTNALDVIARLPERPDRDRQELAVQVALGSALIAVHGYAAPETGRAYDRARALCERLGDVNALFPILSGQFAYHFVRGDKDNMLRTLKEAQQKSEQAGSERLALAANRYIGHMATYSGEFAKAQSAFETLLRGYDAERHRPAPMHLIHDPKLYAVGYLGVLNWILGFPDQARRWQEKAFEYLRELDQAAAITFTRVYAGAGLDELLLDTAAVRAHADAIVELSEQHDLRYFRLSGEILKGWTMARQGQPAEGTALMQRSATERLALGVVWYQIRYLCMLAESYAEHDLTQEGLSTIAEARSLSSRHDEHMWDAELDRLEGQLRLKANGKAELLFQSAVAVAQRQSAKSFELRAATSLARLWRDQGRLAEAQGVLLPVYRWFREGRDTSDLVKAKALLDELA